MPQPSDNIAHPAALFTEHVADLAVSGLTLDTAQAAGLYSLPASALAPLLGWELGRQVQSGLVIPYSTEADGFCRVKLFPPLALPTGETMRYAQRKASGSRLYVPPQVQRLLADATVPLGWTEGEKKALKACQEGLYCLALGGLWNWRCDHRPAPWLNTLAHADRLETIYPDSGVWARPDLLQPVYAFGKALEDRGARVQVAVLPALANGQEGKLDEFLVQHGVAALQTLTYLPLKHTTFRATARWWKGWQGQSDARSGQTPPADKPDTLIRNDRDRVISCQHNALFWLDTHGYTPKIWLDTFGQRVMVDGQPLTDAVVIELVRQMEASEMIHWAESHVHSALMSIGTRQPRSALVAWLETLRWDGKPRLRTFFSEAYGAEVTAYAAACAQVFFLSAVARAYEPGCQADVMVVLIGPQGLGKSKGIASLVPEPAWYTDDLGGDLYDRKAAEGLQGKWLIEFGEFARINRATLDVVKAFLSRRVDHYRPAYGRTTQDFPRQCVFIGTTNQQMPLQDLENRRFMPLDCPQEVADLTAKREQLWAEAVSRYKQGEPWWISDQDLLREVKARQEDARQHDEWEEILRQELLALDTVTLEEAAKRLGVPRERLDKGVQTRLGLVMKALGFRRQRETTGPRTYYWVREVSR